MAESLGTAVLDLTTDDSRLRSGLARSEAETKGTFGRMASGVLGSAAKIAAGFGAYKLGKALFVDPINMAGNFQQTLKVLGAVSGATGGDLDKLSKRAIQLGADTKLPATSAQDAADAMLQLAKAGESTGQIMGSVHGVLLLSAAAEISNADAADMVTKAMGAFGLKASDTGKIVDDFAGAANASQSSIQDVGLAMTQAGAGFKALRVPIGDASTAIALMAKNGVTGGMAGAALNVAFTKLANPTKQATETLKDMNVHLFDSNGKFIGVRGAIEQMSPKLDAMSDKQRLATLAILGGTRGMKALSFVLGGGTKEWDKTQAAVERAGQAQEIANAKTAGFKGALSGLKSTIETLQIEIGTKLLPVATRFIRFLEKVAEAKSFTIAIKVVWSGIVSVGGDIKDAIQKALFGGTDQVIKAGSLRIGQEAIVVDPGLISKLRDAIDGMVKTTDWGAIGKQIGDGISKTIKVSTDALNDMLNSMMTWLDAHKAQIAELGLVIGLTMLAKLLDPSFWAAHWQLIGGIALSAAAVMFPEGKLAEIGLKAVGFLLKPFELLGTKLAALAVEGVLKLSASIETSLGPLAGKIALWIGNAVVASTTTVVGLMVKLGADMITGFINKIAGLGVVFRTAAFTAIVSVIGSLVGAAVSAATNLASDIAKGVMTAPSKLGSFPGLMSTAIVGALRAIIGAAQSAAESIAEKIAAGIKTAPSKIAGLAGDLTGKIGAAISQVAGWALGAAEAIGRNIGQGIVNGVQGMAGAVAGAVAGVAQGAVSHVKGILGISSPSAVFRDEVGKPMGDGLILGFTTKMVAEGGKLADAVEGATKANQPKAVAAFTEWGKRAVDAFDAEASKLKDKLGAQLDAGKAMIDKWKTSLTPAEVTLNKEKTADTIAQLGSLQTKLNEAWAALKALPGEQQKAMGELIAQQKQNMDALKQTAQGTKDDALIAGSRFNKGLSAAVDNPIAAQLIYAQSTFDAAKKAFDQGLVTEAEFVASSDQLDAQLLAAKDASNATLVAGTEATADQQLQVTQAAQALTLLDQYNTYQTALGAQATAGQAVTTQQGLDQAAQLALQGTFNQQTIDATNTKNDALNTLLNGNLEYVAGQERAARDAEATELNTHLVARYQRIETHLNNVVTRTDASFAELARHAKTGGTNLIEELSKAIDDAQPTLHAALQRISNAIASYLKVNSPTELGAMSTLDTWWTRLPATLLGGVDDRPIKNWAANLLTPNDLKMGAYASPVAAGRAPMGAMTKTGGGVNLTQNFNHTPANADPVAIGAVTSWSLDTLRT